MRAIGVTEYGGPEALQLLDLPAEPLGPHQVRVRVTAAAVNPTDTGLRAGLRSDDGKPKDHADVPGMDVAGVVIERGENVRPELTEGQEVCAIVIPNGQHGGYREDLVLPERSVTRIPANADLIAAATLPMNGLTAVQALDVLKLEPGQTLAVTGAAGAFGGYVVQLAKVAGLTVIADAAPRDEKLVRDLGADEIVPRGDDFAEHVRTIYPDGVDGLADGALLDAEALPAVRDGGAVATVRGYTGDGQRGLRVIPVLVRNYGEELEKLERLRDLVEQGKVTLRVADTYPAERATEAHQRLEAGGTRGRLVLRFN